MRPDPAIRRGGSAALAGAASHLALPDVGMIHGRFQPFHNGHLEYLRAAAPCCGRLVVGITNPELGRIADEPADPARATPEANPFTYAERREMVLGVLRDEGIAGAEVVPFPISEPDRWPGCVPGGALHLVRVFDGWGEEKVRRLRAAGYEVAVLDEGAVKEVAGTEVRRRLREGLAWEKLVPQPVARVIRSLPEDRARGLRTAA